MDWMKINFFLPRVLQKPLKATRTDGTSFPWYCPSMWDRPSVRFCLGALCGMILGWSGCWAHFAWQQMVNQKCYIVKFRILGGPGMKDAYIMTTGETWYSFQRFSAGERVCP